MLTPRRSLARTEAQPAGKSPLQLPCTPSLHPIVRGRRLGILMSVNAEEGIDWEASSSARSALLNVALPFPILHIPEKLNSPHKRSNQAS